MPTLEATICERVLWFRQETGYSRRSFAKKAGLDESYLVRVEHKRTPLRFSSYRALHRQFGLNPHWLRTGLGDIKTGFLFDDSDYFGSVKPDELFSIVYDRFLAGEGRVTAHIANENVRQLVADINLIAIEAASGRLLNLPADTIQDAITASDSLQDALEEMLRRTDPSHLREHLAKEFGIKGLTGVSLKRKTVSMSEIQRLIKDAKPKLSQPGAKSALAKELGVAPARISEWLSGDKEPSGEYALQLYHWVYDLKPKH